jgi:GxxExxY protein
MTVYTQISAGLNEIKYHLALSRLLTGDGIQHQFKPRGVLMHRGIKADEFEADLVIAGLNVSELKVLREAFAAAHSTQLFCYLKSWGIDAGLLFDFGEKGLYQNA